MMTEKTQKKRRFKIALMIFLGFAIYYVYAWEPVDYKAEMETSLLDKFLNYEIAQTNIDRLDKQFHVDEIFRTNSIQKTAMLEQLISSSQEVKAALIKVKQEYTYTTELVDDLTKQLEENVNKSIIGKKLGYWQVPFLRQQIRLFYTLDSGKEIASGEVIQQVAEAKARIENQMSCAQLKDQLNNVSQTDQIKYMAYFELFQENCRS
ncbi:MAG: hypothetical protein K0R24_152 [Gammaproteobacteria bacterium]|jgi:hypothetical protein|nr:hypothetical protein [Gammaproteobacteria bacterium]